MQLSTCSKCDNFTFLENICSLILCFSCKGTLCNLITLVFSKTQERCAWNVFVSQLVERTHSTNGKNLNVGWRNGRGTICLIKNTNFLLTDNQERTRLNIKLSWNSMFRRVTWNSCFLENTRKMCLYSFHSWRQMGESWMLEKEMEEERSAWLKTQIFF